VTRGFSVSSAFPLPECSWRFILIHSMLVEDPASNRLPFLLFRICRTLATRRVRGSTRLYQMLRRAGVFRSFTYRVGGRPFSVPVSSSDYACIAADVEGYEFRLLESMATALGRFQDPVLIDCGADIGTFSALLFARSPRIREIVAIEPRPEAVPWLRRNMDALPVKTKVVMGAASDFVGRGFMRHSPVDSSGHACYLAPDATGDIEVITVDSLRLDAACVALKIDVEGGELGALKGARGLLTSARKFAIAVEAHREVAARIGIDPIEYLRFIDSIRKCEFRIAETGAGVDLSRSFLVQCPLMVSNVVAWTA
jgi:FkbM family methyltransferase